MNFIFDKMFINVNKEGPNSKSDRIDVENEPSSGEIAQFQMMNQFKN